MRNRRNTVTTPAWETLRACTYEIARRTSALPDGSLRVDLRKLEGSEAAELVALVDQDALTDRETRRYEELLERAADKPGLFSRLRDLEGITAAARDLRRTVVRRPFSKTEERGLLAEVSDHVQRGLLHTDHVLVLVTVLSQLATGVALAPHARVEDGPVLVVRKDFGLVRGNHDPHSQLTRWVASLAHLERNGWTGVTTVGNEIRIELGPRAKRVMGTPARRAAA
jgi:hypothetical protein